MQRISVLIDNLIRRRQRDRPRTRLDHRLRPRQRRGMIQHDVIRHGRHQHIPAARPDPRHVRQQQARRIPFDVRHPHIVPRARDIVVPIPRFPTGRPQRQVRDVVADMLQHDCRRTTRHAHRQAIRHDRRRLRHIPARCDPYSPSRRQRAIHIDPCSRDQPDIARPIGDPRHPRRESIPRRHRPLHVRTRPRIAEQNAPSRGHRQRVDIIRPGTQID